MERRIKLSPDMVEHFVAVASKCDFDIDIAYNRYVVDAKSFLGVYGLDFSQILTVRYNGFDAAFEELLKTCAIAAKAAVGRQRQQFRNKIDSLFKMAYYLGSIRSFAGSFLYLCVNRIRTERCRMEQGWKYGYR